MKENKYSLKGQTTWTKIKVYGWMMSIAAAIPFLAASLMFGLWGVALLQASSIFLTVTIFRPKFVKEADKSKRFSFWL